MWLSLLILTISRRARKLGLEGTRLEGYPNHMGIVGAVIHCSDLPLWDQDVSIIGLWHFKAESIFKELLSKVAASPKI